MQIGKTLQKRNNNKVIRTNGIDLFDTRININYFFVIRITLYE